MFSGAQSVTDSRLVVDDQRLPLAPLESSPGTTRVTTASGRTLDQHSWVAWIEFGKVESSVGCVFQLLCKRVFVAVEKWELKEKN